MKSPAAQWAHAHNTSKKEANVRACHARETMTTRDQPQPLTMSHKHFKMLHVHASDLGLRAIWVSKAVG